MYTYTYAERSQYSLAHRDGTPVCTVCHQVYAEFPSAMIGQYACWFCDIWVHRDCCPEEEVSISPNSNQKGCVCNDCLAGDL